MAERTTRLPFCIAGALAAAALLSGCGGDDGGDGDQPAIVDASVAEVVAAPDRFDEVRVRGSGSPLGSAGFVLADGGDEIVVLSLRTPALLADQGEELTVVGRVGRLEPFQVEDVMRTVEREGQADTGRRVLPRGTAPGDPYLELINLRREGNAG